MQRQGDQFVSFCTLKICLINEVLLKSSAIQCVQISGGPTGVTDGLPHFLSSQFV